MYVLDILGRPVYQITTTASEKLTLPISYVPSGVYFLKLSDGKSSFSQKMVVAE